MQYAYERPAMPSDDMNAHVWWDAENNPDTYAPEVFATENGHWAWQSGGAGGAPAGWVWHEYEHPDAQAVRLAQELAVAAATTGAGAVAAANTWDYYSSDGVMAAVSANPRELLLRWLLETHP